MGNYSDIGYYMSLFVAVPVAVGLSFLGLLFVKQHSTKSYEITEKSVRTLTVVSNKD